MIRKLSTHGDTLVEVLLAIAVLSGVLGGAFVAANRSLLTTQQNQERAEALKLVETQLEQLKAKPLPAGDDCFEDTDGNCVFEPNGGIPYTMLIEEPFPNVFKVSATWDSVRGTGQDNVELWYRK